MSWTEDAGWSFDDTAALEALLGMSETEFAALSEAQQAAHIDRLMDLVLHETVDRLIEEGNDFFAANRRGLIRSLEKDRRQFNRRLRQRWGLALREYLLVYHANFLAGAEFNRREANAAEAENDYRFFALRGLHARACTVASEVHALLATGHAIGAVARWRTLYEISVAAWTLGHAEQEVAQRYLEHDDVQDYEDAVAYNRYAHRLHDDPFPPDYIERLRDRQQDLKARYGGSFLEEWGWARPVVPEGQKVSLFALAKAANVEHLWPYYKWSSHLSHGGSKGTRLNVVDMGDGDTMLQAGPSNEGLADAASCSLISLTHTTIAFVLCRTSSADPRDMAATQVVTTLSAHAQDAFARAHEALVHDIRALRGDVHDNARTAGR